MVRDMVWRALLVVLLAGCTTAGSAAGQRSASRPPAQNVLSTLLTQPLPPRNLYALADQLKLHPPRPISHVIRHTSPNYPVGRQDTFYVLSDSANKYFKMRATIRAETPHLYLYVQNGVSVNQAETDAAAQYFERSIYPTDRAIFGSEWRPGVDGDPHITCLVGNLRSATAGGFYSAEDEYPHLVNRWSNQREMIYLNSSYVVPGDSAFRQIMAHEFQHMIHWHMHPRDNAWTNEGMSMLAEYVNHFPPDAEAQSYLDSPTTQLNTWSEATDPSDIAHYGGAYLYLQYLYDRYGKGLIREIVADRKYTDFQLIDNALQHLHIQSSGRKLFTDWVVANWVNDRSIAHGQYGYQHAGGKVTSHLTHSVPFSESSRIPAWAPQYTQIDNLSGKQPFTLRFSAPTTIPAVSFAHAGNGWWSNRGDMIDTTLERTVDLRGVKHATLQFQTMYDIEKNYDYAYVEVSRDGGKTWTTLRGTHTTTANPDGANYGNGYTGSSKGWHTETVDLSRYAGHQVELRFQYITDDEYNGQGMVIKNISIPAIHFTDHLSGWRAAGFVPTGRDLLPSDWTVQIISSTSHGVTVSRLPLSHGQGSIDVNPSKIGLKKLVIVVFTTAPRTTVRTSYTLSATS